ncbi:Hypothetical predicted protein [Podarcis lilfordi]|uniref:Uncharacterized protein n=1 Tax=Podarcis lilfordi TaxID=74358 RepID=A0AA35PDH6_9SAUR|nr:Hypothetical predicted protein [Podarcis lilfordi]
MGAPGAGAVQGLPPSNGALTKMLQPLDSWSSLRATGRDVVWETSLPNERVNNSDTRTGLGVTSDAELSLEGRGIAMARQKPSQPQPSELSPVQPTPGCKVVAPPTACSGFLGSFLNGVKMVLSIILFLGLCAFTAYVALLCTALLFAAVQVLFSTLIPSALLILQFLLSAMLLLFCLQWMSEILSQQFHVHDPVL